MQFSTTQKERELKPMDMSFSRTSESRVRHRVLQTSADEIFWNGDSPGLLRSATGFVKLFSVRTATILKSSTLVAYHELVALLNFSNDHN